MNLSKVLENLRVPYKGSHIDNLIFNQIKGRISGFIFSSSWLIPEYKFIRIYKSK